MLKSALITWLTISLAVVTHAESGGISGGGGGGDAYSAEFTSTAYSIMQHLALNPLPEIPLQELSLAVAKTQVSSADSLQLDGRHVDAINYPDPVLPRIEISRSSWDKLGANRSGKTVLVLHEYLRIAGFDDSRYQLSHLYLSGNACARAPLISIRISMKLNKTCDRISREDLASIRELDLSAGRIRAETPPLDEINEGDFYGLTGLKTLKINFLSSIKKISPSAFKGTVALRELEIQQATFCGQGGQPARPEGPSIPGGIFDGLSNLESLRWLSNCIAPEQTIPQDFLGGLSHLKKFFFRGNLEDKALLLGQSFFSQSPGLRELQIWFTAIDEIHPEAMKPLRQLSSLSFNAVEFHDGNLDAGIFAGLPLKMFDISQSNISEVADKKLKTLFPEAYALGP